VSAPEQPAAADIEDGERLSAVRRLESTALGSRALQRLAELAVRVLEVDAAQVSLLGDVDLLVGGAGMPPGALGRRLPLAESICAVTASTGADALVVRDAVADPRLAAVPAVTGGRVGAYLGIPLATGGVVIGALCVQTVRPRDWQASDVAMLRQLADAVVTELELSALSREFEAHRLRFELAIDAAEIGSFDWDLVTRRLIWDDRLVELFGYERDAFDETIESFNARLHPDDLPRVSEALQTAIDTVGAYDAEYRILLPTGETRWIHARGRALADDAGLAVRLLGAAYDSTRQRHGDARVARVLEAMNAAFFQLDRQWRFSYVNAEAERLLQSRREELVGGEIWELFPAAVASDFEKHYRGAMTTGEERVFEAYYPAPLDAWYEVRAWPGPDGLAVYFLDISERRAAEERARASAARLRVIADVTAVLSRTMGPGEAEDAALRAVARAVVPVLGDWAVVSLVDEDGRIRDVGSWHHEPALRPRTDRYAELRLAALDASAPFPTALRTGHALAVEDLEDAVRRLLRGEVLELFQELDPASAVVLPLIARGRTVGGLSIYRGGDRRPMDGEEFAAAREVADRTALALDNSRLYEQQRRLAETLQRSMLTAPPQPDHAEIVVRYHPALEVAEVGGDWYDAFVQPGGATMLVIGDVVGHDSEAAAAMGQLRGLLRGIGYREEITPAQVLTQLDAAIRGLELGAMATAAIARIEQTPEERAAGLTRLRWSNAGHPPPLVRHDDGRIEELACEHAELMLGVDPAAVRTDSTVTVRRGSTVLLYTDGLVEGRDLPLDDGVALLRAALTDLAGLPLPELCDALLARLRPGGLQDDVALVALRLHPQ
jgi:serine phosphatase RsbU (regulator of sigma subunit)/PAS domain-containing protein